MYMNKPFFYGPPEKPKDPMKLPVILLSVFIMLSAVFGIWRLMIKAQQEFLHMDNSRFYSVEELKGYSSLVILCSVKENVTSKIEMPRPVEAGYSIYEVEPREIYKGYYDKSLPLYVKVKTGMPVNKPIEFKDPLLQTGIDCVLFLYSTGKQSGYSMLKVSGNSRGIFRKADREDFSKNLIFSSKSIINKGVQSPILYTNTLHRHAKNKLVMHENDEVFDLAALAKKFARKDNTRYISSNGL